MADALPSPFSKPSKPELGPAARAQARSGRVSPNLWVLLLCLGGLFTESFLLLRSDDGVFGHGPLLAKLAAAVLIWLWITAGWLLWACARGARRLTAAWPRLPRVALVGLLFVLLDAAVLLYFLSWALHSRTGAFASFDALRYAFFDYPAMTWFYVTRSEPASLALLGLAVLGAWIALPRLLGTVARAAPRSRPRWLRAISILLWLFSAASVSHLLRQVEADRSEIRRDTRVEALKFRLNPWIAIAASWRESAREESIHPILSARELRPRDSDWKIPAGANRPSIVFVKIESIRSDVLHRRHQGVEIVPNLNALAALGLELTRAYSVTTHTDYSDVSTLSSLYPLRTRQHYYYKKTDPWPKTLIYDLLKPAGYATAIVAAENLSWGKMDQFLLTPNLDFFFDAERSGMRGRLNPEDSGILREVRAGVLSAGVLDDEPTTDVALRWLEGPLVSGRPFFLNLDLQSPHFPYELPASVKRPFQPSTVEFDASFVQYLQEKTDLMRNVYYNALREADRQLGRLVSALRAAGRLDDTILVVYGDHGEAFNENGHVTHAKEPIEVVVRVPCVIVASRYLRPRKEDYPAESIDLLPTILGLIGWPPHPNFQGINLLARDRPPLEKRALFIHTENPLSRTDAVLLAGRWKYSLDRRAHRGRLYDLAADPGEARDVHAREPSLTAKLARLLGEWRRRQLAYYHFPMYFEHYYPPTAPAP